MLAASALRLAAIEVLRPTASLSTGTGFPTLAEHRVFDSRSIGVDELDPDRSEERPWTPCLSVYSEEVRADRLGPTSGPSARPMASLVVNAELAVGLQDEEGPFADASADTDPTARLVLDALCAQVRAALQYSPAGGLFREIGVVDSLTITPFAMPQLGIRWLRSEMRFTCALKDDKFTDAGGLPEPCASLRSRLPPGSYARAKLDELGLAFAATTREALAGITVSTTIHSAEGPTASV